jgi:Lar family restriction alleviation protein
MTAELLPCPWCSGADASASVRRPSYVLCHGCAAHGPVADKPTAAIAAWNRRALSTSPGAGVGETES